MLGIWGSGGFQPTSVPASWERNISLSLGKAPQVLEILIAFGNHFQFHDQKEWFTISTFQRLGDPTEKAAGLPALPKDQQR